MKTVNYIFYLILIFSTFFIIFSNQSFSFKDLGEKVSEFAHNIEQTAEQIVHSVEEEAEEIAGVVEHEAEEIVHNVENFISTKDQVIVQAEDKGKKLAHEREDIEKKVENQISKLKEELKNTDKMLSDEFKTAIHEVDDKLDHVDKEFKEKMDKDLPLEELKNELKQVTITTLIKAFPKLEEVKHANLLASVAESYSNLITVEDILQEILEDASSDKIHHFLKDGTQKCITELKHSFEKTFSPYFSGIAEFANLHSFITPVREVVDNVVDNVIDDLENLEKIKDHADVVNRLIKQDWGNMHELIHHDFKDLVDEFINLIVHKLVLLL